MRGLGAVELAGDLPPEVTALFALLTQLGDVWFVFLLLSGVYWLADGDAFASPRRDAAVAVAVGLAGLAATLALKNLFALPRPPGAAEATPPEWLPLALAGLYESAATASGFGFPSGHATGATVVYGGLAVLLSAYDRRRRFLAAGAVVAVVCLSRVVLGVHYLIDVAAGVGVGAVVVLATTRAAGYGTDRPVRPERAFAVAAAFALAGLVVAAAQGHAGEVRDAAVALGAALGGVAGWHLVDGDEPATSTRWTVAGVVATGGLAAVAFGTGLPTAVVALAAVLAVAGVLALPALPRRTGLGG